MAAREELEEALEQLLHEVAGRTQPQPASGFSDLRGKVAIVSGGATGLGRAVAVALGRAGVHIGFNYLADETGAMTAEAEQTAAELRQLEIRVHHEPCDVRDPEAVAGFVARVKEALGGLHVLVNNAGVARDRAVWRMSDEEWREVVATNLDGAFHLIRAVSPWFRKQRYGKIVTVASIHGFRPGFGLANYAASKAGLIGLTRAAAVELGPSNVNVNAVAPGYIRGTRMTEGLPPEVLERAEGDSLLRRLVEPDDVGNLVVFLCSEMARNITGAVIPVDAGSSR